MRTFFDGLAYKNDGRAYKNDGLDMEDFRKITAPKTIIVEQAKKTKPTKGKKKKDPNEPQKPLSVYGQNPNATFGELSKIVASMWDSLGEEQKQKDFLKALTLYTENQMSQVVVEPVDLDPPVTQTGPGLGRYCGPPPVSSGDRREKLKCSQRCTWKTLRWRLRRPLTWCVT
uniref:HMG box domain-containing protein n=1 Tax=Leptobrachium leishanense TaxID=445787 RepID=A0A8C5Q763_9ANUR